MQNNFKWLVIFAAISVILSCKDQPKNSEHNSDTSPVTPSKVTSIEEQEKTKPKITWRDNVAKLKEITPLSKTDFTEWLPKSLSGMNQNKLMINDYNDLATLNVDFTKGEQYFKLNIVDGAGDRGSRMTAPAFTIATQNLDQETYTGYLKTTRENQIIAKERYTKLTEDYNIQFFYNNRFFTTIQSNLDRDQVWNLIMDLNFDNLGN